MNSISKLVGSKIREIRKDRGLTQEQVAEKAGMDFTSIGAAERGVRNLSLNSLFKVAKALGVEIEDIVRVPTKNQEELLIQELEKLLKSMDIEQLHFMIEAAKLISNYGKKNLPAASVNSLGSQRPRQ